MTLPICLNCQHCFTAYADNRTDGQRDRRVWPVKEGQYRRPISTCQRSASKLIVDVVTGRRREQHYIACQDMRAEDSEKAPLRKLKLDKNDPVFSNEQLDACDVQGNGFIAKETLGMKFRNWFRGTKNKEVPAGYIHVDMLMKRDDLYDPTYDPMKTVLQKHGFKAEDKTNEN